MGCCWPGNGVTLVMPFLQPVLAKMAASARTVGKISLFMFIYFVQVKIRCRACEFLSFKKLSRPSGLGTASRRSHTILVLFRENVKHRQYLAIASCRMAIED